MITLFYSKSIGLNHSCFERFQLFYEHLISILFLNISIRKSPCCEKGILIKHGYYTRCFRTHSGEETLTILRVKCSVCCKTHALLPSDLIPYCQCGTESSISFILNYEAGKNCDEGLADTNGLLDENDYYRCIKKYKTNWKGRIESLHFNIHKLSENFIEYGAICIRSFCRHFLQMRDPPDFSIFITT